MDSRHQFEEKYPLPEGMYFDNEQNAYAGTKDFWLWCTRWESWQASRESLVVEIPEMIENCAEDMACAMLDAIHSAGIRTK